MPMLALTALEKLQRIPGEFWWKLALGVLVVIVAVIVIRRVAGTNKMILAVVTLIVMTVVGFNWIYERNEPAFLTPMVQKIAPFFPAKDSYGAKQASKPKAGP